MAKPKSEDKRNAILSAATEVFADRGLTAPTSAIAKAAGVAEGTLFIYFKSKDELLNALYRDLKLQMADSMMAGFPRKESVKQRLQHVWNRYVDWGAENPTQQSVLKQIRMWNGLTPESKLVGSAPFVEIQTMADDAMEQRILQDLPQQFIGAAMSALAETTMELVRQDPEKADVYRNAGFEMLWSGIARKK